eukprot:159044_1
MNIMVNVFQSYASTVGMRIYAEDFVDAKPKQLLPKSEHILTEEIGNIKLFRSEATYSEDSAKYKGEHRCGVMSVVIAKNEPYPITRIKKYCTYNPGSTKANFRLFEGDAEDVANNYFLSNITITNVPRGSCDKAMIDVVFDIDHNGIATIQATINKTNTTDFGTEMETMCYSGSCTMSLGVLSKDGSLTDDDISKYRNMMANWFSSDAIQNVLNK